MTREQIIQNNSLIADFMGFSKNIDGLYRYLGIWMENPPFRYHDTWNELMEVIEKIEDLNYDVQMGGGSYCRIWDIDLDRRVVMPEIETSYPTKIESVYSAIIEFIKWYNENKEL